MDDKMMESGKAYIVFTPTGIGKTKKIDIELINLAEGDRQVMAMTCLSPSAKLINSISIFFVLPIPVGVNTMYAFPLSIILSSILSVSPCHKILFYISYTSRHK